MTAQQRGRKSAASLSVIRGHGASRPGPPDELTEDQAAEWRVIVGRMPADWFTRETHPLLVDLCRHIVRSRVIAGKIDSFDPEWLMQDEGARAYDRLCAMGERETRMMASLATKMRLTQQSRYNAQSASTAERKGSNEPSHPWQQKRAAVSAS